MLLYMSTIHSTFTLVHINIPKKPTIVSILILVNKNNMEKSATVSPCQHGGECEHVSRIQLAINQQLYSQ